MKELITELKSFFEEEIYNIFNNYEIKFKELKGDYNE